MDTNDFVFLRMVEYSALRKGAVIRCFEGERWRTLDEWREAAKKDIADLAAFEAELAPESE